MANHYFEKDLLSNVIIPSGIDKNTIAGAEMIYETAQKLGVSEHMPTAQFIAEHINKIKQKHHICKHLFGEREKS